MPTRSGSLRRSSSNSMDVSSRQTYSRFVSCGAINACLNHECHFKFRYDSYCCMYINYCLAKKFFFLSFCSKKNGREVRHVVSW